MDIQPQAQQPISDDQELAKVLAGINQQADAAAATPVTDVTPPAAPAPPTVAEETAPAPVAAEPEETTMPPASAPITAQPLPMSGDLESIKKDALSELRPLVDKLDVAPEEKFDTYLLLLRSTDDQALIAPAHEAARGITDEARRAQALLDIIKEIDYLSGAGQQTA
jgi:hypothetical protein